MTTENQLLREALQKYIAWCDAESNHAGTTFYERVDMCRDAENAARAALSKPSEALSQRGETCASASVAGLKVVIDETMRPDEMKLAQPATQCPLTECQGRPRCERCIAMDAKATQPSPATERAGLVALHTMREAQQAAAVPAGWKLVPVEPTQEMLSKSWLAVGGALDRENQRAFYSTMLSSAPAAPKVLGNSDADYWLSIRSDVIEALEKKGLRIVSNKDGVQLVGITGGEEPTLWAPY